MPAHPKPGTPSRSASNPDARRARWAYVAAGAASLAVVAFSGALLAPRTLTDAAPPTSPPTAHRTAPSPKPAAQPDIGWTAVAGVLLPFSRTHGPHRTTDGAASGYSRTIDGAAVAAVQVLVRTSPATGPSIYEPVIATQVTGTNTPAMKLATRDEYQRLRARAGTPEGAPIPDATSAEVRGYVVRAADLTAGTASVDVVLSAAQLDAEHRVVAFHVNLLWQNDDWRVVAPANGDWATAATTLGAAPSGLVSYGG